MATTNYNANSPADDETIAKGPEDIRINQEALRQDGIVNAGTLNGLASGNTTGLIPVSNGNVNTNLNADKLDGKEAADFANASHVHDVATGSSNGFESNTHFNKVEGIAAGAEVNQNAFSNVLVSSTTVQSASKTGTLEIVPGKNIAVTPDDVNKRLTLAVTGKVDSAAAADTLSQALSVALGGTGLTGGAAPAGHGLGGLGVRLSVDAGYDLNTLKANGWYDVYKPANGVSGLTWHNILVIASGDANYVTQLAFGMTESNNLVWMRTLGGSTNAWSPWVRIASMGDIPTSLPANGGNADTATSAQTNIFTASGLTSALPLFRLNIPNVVADDIIMDSDGNILIEDYTHQSYRNLYAAYIYSNNKQVATVDQIPSSAAYDAGHSFADNGYQKLSNGLILQWGNSTGTGNPTSVTFPVTFPNQCFSIVLTFEAQSQSAANVNSKSTSFFTWQRNSGNSGFIVYWFAIGY